MSRGAEAPAAPAGQALDRYALSAPLALAGGFLEAYTFVTRGGVFANAQTGNIARLGISLANRDLFAALRYFLPVCVFVLGVTLSMQLKRRFERRGSPGLRWRQAALLVETALLILAGLFPAGPAYDIPVTAIVALVCAIQAESFRTFHGHPFASTMCTGNLRSATENLNHYFSDRERRHLTTALAYYGVDGIFVLGVAVGVPVTKHLGCAAVWFCAGALALMALVLMLQTKKQASGIHAARPLKHNEEEAIK